ncbi:shikimate dehydrogenase [Buchnera aphidicola]|uniref:shikimate dehydrogenase n=1 Tax=Buchnera aphidicola TaxID=9 RepID=UPI0031B8715E
MKINKCIEGSFGLFGNPIKHSKSPLIHNFFSKIMNINYIYKSYCVSKNDFYNILNNFFLNNGLGANITSPFKELAYDFSDILSKEAKISGSVNTLLKLRNGMIFGDNTDGLGLLYDLNRLKYIKKNKKVLIIGAGGAVKGILLSLFSLNCSVYILNRTDLRVLKLIKKFKFFGKIRNFNSKKYFKKKFDLIIHATSLGYYGKFPLIKNFLVNKHVPCYDLFYSNSITPFLSWYKKNGGNLISDGFGMLISQAAYSFKLWHGVLPNIDFVIDFFKKKKIIKT